MMSWGSSGGWEAEEEEGVLNRRLGLRVSLDSLKVGHCLASEGNPFLFD